MNTFMRDVAVMAVTFSALTKATDYPFVADIDNGCYEYTEPSYSYSYVESKV